MVSKADLRRLTDKLADERSKKVVLVAHCILNEGARYQGGALRKGGNDEIIDELQRRGIGIVQMRCPEQLAWGGVLRPYMWLPLGRRNKVIYRLRGLLIPLFATYTKLVARRVAKEAVAQIEDFVRGGYELVGVVGISGSPLCGINRTLDLRRSAEFIASKRLDDLERKSLNAEGIQAAVIKGRGFLMQAIAEQMAKRNLDVTFYEYDLMTELGGDKAPIPL